MTQNGVAFMQLDEVNTTATRLPPYFADVSFYTAAVPTYVGGVMTFAWACNQAGLREQPLELIQQRFSAANIKTRFYNPHIHQGCFALPQYIVDSVAAAIKNQA